jgi:glycosyltransferase involved in cell wall biosynthesis
MKALLLDTMPMDAAQQKSAHPESFRINGLQVYSWSVGHALLKYGTFDRYYFVDPVWGQNAASKQLSSAIEPDARVHVLSPTDLGRLREVEQLVFMSTTSYFFRMLPLRGASNRPDWPICGVIHSLAGAMLSPLLVSLLMDDCGPHDALFCPTMSGRRAVEQHFEMLLDHLGPMAPASRRMPIALPIVPHGLDVASFQRIEPAAARRDLDIPDRAAVILYFGRLSATGKADLFPLLLAFRELRQRCPNALLVIAGDDTVHEQSSPLRQAAQFLGVADAFRVCTNPGEEQKQQLFAAADIFVAMSDNVQETFGISVTEAMSAGLPVVAADWDGYKELVESGVTGFLVPTTMPRLGVEVDMLNASRDRMGDRIVALTTAIDVPALARDLETLVDNPGLRRRMGDEARRRAARLYDWPVVVGAYEARWNESLERGKHATRRSSSVQGVFTYDYQRVFSHYPTRLGDDDDVLSLSAAGADRDHPAWMLVSRTSQGFQPALFQAIRDRLGEAPRTTVEEIAGHFAASGAANEFLTRIHVARLVKYGLLVRESAAVAAAAAVQLPEPAIATEHSR